MSVVGILRLNEIISLIYNFDFSLTVQKIVSADLSQKYMFMTLEHKAAKEQRTKHHKKHVVCLQHSSNTEPHVNHTNHNCPRLTCLLVQLETILILSLLSFLFTSMVCSGLNQHSMSIRTEQFTDLSFPEHSCKLDPFMTHGLIFGLQMDSFIFHYFDLHSQESEKYASLFFFTATISFYEETGLCIIFFCKRFLVPLTKSLSA